MSNFLKNLAKRSAGIPLATEYFPTPSPTFADDFRSRAELNENAPEDAANLSTDTPAGSPPPRSINVATAATNQIQRVPEVDKSGGPKQEPITPIKSSSERTSLHRVGHVFVAQPEAGSDPGKTFVDDRSEPAIQQTIVVRETTHVENNLRPLLSTRDAQTFVPPQTFAQQTEEHTPGTQELSPADQTIRPAFRDRPISLQFPKVTDETSRTPAPLPIHVRVGRIEVRGNAPQQTSNVMSKQPAPLGFAAYQRLRRYRI